MQSPVVVARASSASHADHLAALLRDQGIEAVARTMLDRTAYPSLGGATVLVPAAQRIEAELELMLLEQSEDTGVDPAAEAPGIRPARTWVRVGSWVALAGMAAVAVIPSLGLIWRSLAP